MIEVFVKSKSGLCNNQSSASDTTSTPAGGISPPCRRTGRLLAGAAGGDALERIPQRGIATASLVDREVALNHRLFGVEGGDADLDVKASQRLQAVPRSAAVRRLMPVSHAELAGLRAVTWGASGETDLRREPSPIGVSEKACAKSGKSGPAAVPSYWGGPARMLAWLRRDLYH